MAITHDDLSIRKHQTTDVSGKLALFLVIFSVLCSLIAFVLCLSAEGSRSEVTWLLMSSQDGSKEYKCFYNGSGRMALAYSVAAFLLLAFAMFGEHAYMLVAITNPQPAAMARWAGTPDPRATATSGDLTWQACCLFFSTWTFFALAEVLLMIGIGVESGHLSNWATPRSSCHAIRPGVFTVAGVFGLITVFLGVGLYLTALRTQRLHLEKERHGQRIPHVSSTYPHLPPSTPGIPHTMMGGAHQNQQQPPQHLDKTSTSA